MKCSAYIATSLDGFIARKNGKLDWLDDASATVPEGEDCGFAAFLESVDVLLMGRNTFEKVMSLDVEWPYGDTPAIVLGRNPLSFTTVPGPVSRSVEDPDVLLSRLKGEGFRHAYVDGGITIQRFLAAGLLDEITMTLIPVILGEGIPLFSDAGAEVSLKLIDSRSYDFGFVQVHYGIEKSIFPSANR